MKEKLIATQGL